MCAVLKFVWVSIVDVDVDADVDADADVVGDGCCSEESFSLKKRFCWWGTGDISGEFSEEVVVVEEEGVSVIKEGSSEVSQLLSGAISLIALLKSEDPGNSASGGVGCR
jgi:hypothetical protein